MLNDKDIQKLIKAQEGVFVTKGDFDEFKNDIVEFKNEILTGQDEILERLNNLSQEKTIGDTQDKRQKEVLKIHNEALKRSKILTDEEVVQISKSSVF